MNDVKWFAAPIFDSKFRSCSFEFFEEDVEETHDFFTEDLDLPGLVYVFVRVEDN